MRTETYIRKSLGMKAHYVTRVEESEREVVAQVERIPHRRLRCGRCGLDAKRTKGRTENPRRWRDEAMLSKWLVIEYRPWRVVCPVCGVVTEEIPWSERWSRLTRRLAQSIAAMSKDRDWKAVAKFYQVDWKTVLAVIRRAVERGLACRNLKPVRWIGIDEVSRKKGHEYLTLVYDLKHSELLWIGQGRKEETLEGFFSWLGKRRSAHIEVVCMDMWKPYLNAVRAHAPQATVAFDRFHLVQHLNAAVDEVRRSLVRKLSDRFRALVKGTRFVLLKNPWNLTPKQKQQLNALVRSNSPLSRAWYLKEDFQRFFDYVSEGWATKHLKHWLGWAARSRLEPFKRMARMVRNHLDGILAWTKIRVTNGAVEGMNNKVKLVSHRAFGFRNVENYKTAIYHCCANLPA